MCDSKKTLSRFILWMAMVISVIAFSDTNVFGAVSTVSKGDLQVISGANRFQTANQISQATYATADTAVLVDADNFPDALAAGPLARAYQAPILLTRQTALNSETMDELQRLKVRKVFLVGGTGAISLNVENSLRELGYDVQRLYGSNRYQTAIEVSKVIQAKIGAKGRAVITVGDDFADALAVGSFASRDGFPILLTGRYSISQAAIDHLIQSRIYYVNIIGGEGAIDPQVVQQLERANILVHRVSGSTRVETSTEIANQFFSKSTRAVIANGWNFVDALAATPYAAQIDAPILLVNQTNVQAKVLDHLRYYEISKVDTIGGEAAVSSAVREKVQSAINDDHISVRVKNSDGTYSTKTVVGRFWDAYAREAFDLQNQHRIKNGKCALIWSDDLLDSAKLRSAELSILFSHTRPDGTSCNTAATTQPIHGENVACGYFSPQEVFEGFRSSSDHNENVLNSTYTKGSFGCIVVDGQFYWTALFAR